MVQMKTTEGDLCTPLSLILNVMCGFTMRWGNSQVAFLQLHKDMTKQRELCYKGAPLLHCTIKGVDKYMLLYT